jgi:hypothetical protein
LIFCFRFKHFLQLPFRRIRLNYPIAKILDSFGGKFGTCIKYYCSINCSAKGAARTSEADFPSITAAIPETPTPPYFFMGT